MMKPLPAFFSLLEEKGFEVPILECIEHPNEFQKLWIKVALGRRRGETSLPTDATNMPGIARVNRTPPVALPRSHRPNHAH